jgi:cation transport ATPase
MSGPLKKILGGSAKETVEAVANVVDKFVQNPEEKEAARQAIEQEISERWESDMSSDSWLSKNVRPLTLATIVAFLISMTFFEGFGVSNVSERWIGLWEMVSVTVIGGYFAVRSVDKRGRLRK